MTFRTTSGTRFLKSSNNFSTRGPLEPVPPIVIGVWAEAPAANKKMDAVMTHRNARTKSTASTSMGINAVVACGFVTYGIFPYRVCCRIGAISTNFYEFILHLASSLIMMESWSEMAFTRVYFEIISRLPFHRNKQRAFRSIRLRRESARPCCSFYCVATGR